MTRLLLAILLCTAAAVSAQDKPKVAVFPLGGISAADLRDRIGFSIRTKLNRDGTYEAIDGPTMAELAAPATQPISPDTPPDSIRDLANGSDALVLIWGDCSPSAGQDHLRLQILDLREKSPSPRPFDANISDGTQVRFAVEKLLATLPGVKPFAHPDEQAVHHDAQSDALFEKNPNLVIDPDFATAGHWQATYQADQYQAPAQTDPPDIDHVAIIPQDGQKALAMSLSKEAAESNGLACLSDAIAIQPGVRYRLRFKYRSDGPSQQVFVKGYTPAKSLSGTNVDREIYRLQVPPSGATGGQWQTVEADVDPQNPNFPVPRLRIDLYAYLGAGTIMFTDVELRAVGPQPNH